MQNKQEKTEQYSVSPSTEFSQLGYFADPSDTPELPKSNDDSSQLSENNGYESSDSVYPPYRMRNP